MNTKRSWIHTACIYIPALVIIGYKYTNIDFLIDISLMLSVFGIAVVGVMESKNKKEEKNSSETNEDLLVKNDKYDYNHR